MLRFMPVLIIVASVILYHVSQKSIPKGVNPWAVLSIAYAGALCFTVMMWSPWKSVGLENPRASLIVAILLGVACVGIEAGYLFAYKNGWQITRLSSLVAVSTSVSLIAVSSMFFQETFNFVNVAGFLLATFGVVMMQFR